MLRIPTGIELEVDQAAKPAAETPKIVRRKLSDEVFERLLRALQSGDYPPGSQLPSERGLMATYGVGRPAVREAMQTLEKLGLIAISHGERARVVLPTAADIILQVDRTARHVLSTSPQSLEHLKEAREFFEVGMASEAARRATSEDVHRLEAALSAQQAHLKGDRQAFVAADMEFHTAIAAVTRNAVFEAMSRAMLQWLRQFHSGVLHWKQHEHVTLAEHRTILDAIAAGEPESAAEAMRVHLRRSRALYQPGRVPASNGSRIREATG